MRLAAKMMIFLVMLFLIVAFAEIPLTVAYKTDAFRFGEDNIKLLVLDALKIKLTEQDYSEGFVYAYSKQEGKEQYLVVNLLKPDTYGITSFRLDLNNQRVARVIPGYVEEEPLDPSVCGTCPDPELRVILAYITDFPNSTVPAVNKVKDALTAAKIKFILLKDSEESKTSVLNYLSCPKMIVWGRVGHGGTNGAIMFGYKGQSGSLTTKDITTAPFKDVIKGKYYPFNSCYVGGNRNTFGRGLISSGAVWMCAGDDVTIYAGSSEPVWANFLVDVCTKNTEVIATFDKYMKTAKDKWRYQSIGTGPYYPFQDQTVVKAPVMSNVKDNVFSLSVNSTAVTFNHVPGTISIYTVAGKLIYEILSTQPRTSWNCNSFNNQNVDAGIYVAVLKYNRNNRIQKLFRIVR